MQGMIFNSFLGEFRISFTKKLIIDTNAVVGQSFTMAIIDAFADIQEFEVIVNCLLMFLDVIV